MQEAKEQMVDIAEDVVFDALTDEEDKGRKDTMARYVLSSQGRTRGWGTASQGISVKNSAGGTIIVQWADGTAFGETSGEEESSEVGEEFAERSDASPLQIEHEDTAA
jgi:hypothetical protein